MKAAQAGENETGLQAPAGAFKETVSDGNCQMGTIAVCRCAAWIYCSAWFLIWGEPRAWWREPGAWGGKGERKAGEEATEAATDSRRK